MSGVRLFAFGLTALLVALYFWIPASNVGTVTTLAITFLPVLKTDGLTGEEKEAIEALNKRFKSLDLDAVTSEEVNALVAAEIKKLGLEGLDVAKFKELVAGTAIEQLKTVMLEQGKKITALELGGNSNPERPKSIREQVAEYVEKNKDLIERAKNREKVNLPPFALKAAITMTESASLGGSAFLPNVQVLPGVIDLVRVQPTFWDRLLKPFTKANPLVWVNKYNKQGNATFIGEGTLKALASFELQTETSVPKKVAERMKVSTEMLNDIDYLAGLIEQELRYEVKTAANTAVLTGTASATSPKGVTKVASTYSLVSITGTVQANNSDAIIAAIAQLRSTNFNGLLTAYMNPIDIAIMNLQKSTQGVYVIPPYANANGSIVGGVSVIEDNNIAVGYLLIGDMSKYHIQMFQDFFIAWGWENDDFSKNLVTVIGEMRFHQWVSGNETGAFVYDTFANIKTAIS